MSRVETPPSAPPATQTPSTVLVVDDEPAICWAFERMLSKDGHTVLTASSAEEGLEIAAERKPDLVVLDVRLPEEDGISALPKFSATADCPVVIMTAFGDLETAVEAVKRGACEYLVKPFPLDEARRICSAALASGNTQPPATVQHRTEREERLVGQSPAMQQAFRQVALVARSNLSVLITGETGTGKELVAAAIHRHSDRCDAPYVPIAPVAFNEDLVESELFGHVRGAFTGASEDRAGLFELAEGGTVLLDEIGDLPMRLQLKLLRVLEQREYSRVGDVTPRRCDVRVLAATNCDLWEAVKSGRFREDLYYRLAGLQIHLPPLRERKEDIGTLCRHFLAQLGDSSSTQLNDQLVTELESRHWHGNVRELRNAVEHAAVVARGRALTINDFPDPQPDGESADQNPERRLIEAVTAWFRQQISDADSPPLQGALGDVVEPTLLRLVLEHTQGNRAAAAEILGIDRGTLRTKMRSHGLSEPTD